MQIPEIAGLNPEQLTVGRLFRLHCDGEVPPGFSFERAQLRGPEAQKYALVARGLKSASDRSFTLDVVSYDVAATQIDGFKLVDGEMEIELSSFSVKIESVISVREGDKPPEPYGFVVSNLGWPIIYTLAGSSLTVALVIGAIILGMRRTQRRKLIGEMKNFDSALSPEAQFFKRARQIEAQNLDPAGLEESFKIYLVRRFRVPAHGLSVNETVRELKSRWPRLKAERREVENILKDFKKMSELPGALHSNEKQISPSYMKKLYRFVDHAEDRLRKGDLR